MMAAMSRQGRRLRVRHNLADHGGIATRCMKIGDRFSFEQQHISHATLGEDVCGRRTGKVGTNDDDLG